MIVLLSFCLSVSVSLPLLSLCASLSSYFWQVCKLFLISWLCLIVWQWQEACPTRSTSIGWSPTWSMLASTTATLLFGRISLWRYSNHQWDFSFCRWNIFHFVVYLFLTYLRNYAWAGLYWGGDSSVVRAPDSWLKGRGFESLLERRENFLLQCQLSVLTLISVSVPPPCYHSST